MQWRWVRRGIAPEKQSVIAYQVCNLDAHRLGESPQCADGWVRRLHELPNALSGRSLGVPHTFPELLLGQSGFFNQSPHNHHRRVFTFSYALGHP